MVESRGKQGNQLWLAIIQVQDGDLDKVYSYGIRKKRPNSICTLKIEAIGLANRWEVL